MRHFIVVVMAVSGLAHARLSTFNELDTIRKLEQGVSVFAQADIDHDGDIDWVTQNRARGEIAVVFNERYGKFAPIIRSASVLDISAFDLGDVDGDSVADVLVAGGSGESGGREYPADLSVIFAGANRQFEDSADLPVDDKIKIARFMDVNGDGRNDILAAFGIYGSTIGWFENGVSGWKTVQTIDTSLGSLGLSCWIAIADLDSDGKKDFLLGNDGSRSICSYINEGNGLFTKKTVASDITIASGVVADIDLDGDLDILTGRLIFYRDGDTYTKDTISDPPVGEAHAIAVGDVNNDGYTDIVASVWKEDTYLWQSIPGNKFTRSSIDGSEYPKAVSIADADYDRFNDVVLVEQTAGVLRFARNSGIFAFERKTLFKYDRVNGFRTLDLQSDKDIDFLLYRETGGRPAVSLYEDTGNGGYKSRWAATRQGDDFIYDVQTADFNEDGLFDITVTGDKVASWYEQTAPLQFTEHRFSAMSVCQKPLQLVDLDADRHIDAAGVFESFQNEVFIIGFRNNGTGQFTEDTIYRFPQIAGNYPKTFYYIDANGDGSVERSMSGCMDCVYFPFDVNNDARQDLLVPRSDSTWFTLRENTGKSDGNGDRMFINHRLKSGGGDMACADIDNDGRDDVVMLDDIRANLTWISQDTLFGFFSLHTIAFDNCAASVKIVDYDRDGWKDVVCADTNDNIAWYRNLLGVQPAKPDIPVLVVSSVAVVVRRPLKPAAAGNGRFVWRLPPDAGRPTTSFYLVNGARMDIPVSVRDGRCIADIGRRRGNAGRLMVWALYDENGALLGKGLLPAVE